MTLNYLIGFCTIVRREVLRFLSYWRDTILPPIVTTILYFLIFGHVMGQRIGMMEGVSYVQYIAPGLIMMAVIMGSYLNVGFSFFTAKFFHSIENLLIAPIPNWLILIGYLSGGVLRGCLLAIALTIVALLFTHMHLQHFGIIIMAVFFTAIIFSLAGFINAIFAKKFDDLGSVPSFVLTPLIYLGGVFFSISLLPPVWRVLAQFNPILYFINLFRYGMLGRSDVNVAVAFIMLIGLSGLLFWFALSLLNRGVSIKT